MRIKMTPEEEAYLPHLHRRLMERRDYRRLTEAKTDAEAVEGSLLYDTVQAASMLRDENREMSIGDVVLEPIAKALAVLMNREVDWEVANAIAQRGRMIQQGLISEKLS